MRKLSASNNNGEENVHSDISCGGYITSDEEVVMPQYLVHLPSQNDVIIEMDVEEELNEMLNFGDLDYDGDKARDFDDTMREF